MSNGTRVRFFFGASIFVNSIGITVVEPNKVVKWHPGLAAHWQAQVRLQLVSQWREWPEDIEFTWFNVIYWRRMADSKCNSMHIMSRGTVTR